MERISTQHGSRLDDELKHETEPLVRGAAEGHVEEVFEQEGAGDYEPQAGVGRVEGGAAWEALGPDPVTARRELSRHLPLGVFPAEREALVEQAERDGATAQVTDTLRGLPTGTRFENVYAVWRALGGPVEEQDPPRRVPR
jgi:hypothetical protein